MSTNSSLSSQKQAQITRNVPRLKRLRFYFLGFGNPTLGKKTQRFFQTNHGARNLGLEARGRFNYPTLDSHVFFEHLDSM